MKKIILLLLISFAISGFANSSAESDKLTRDLTVLLTQTDENELIPINIVLLEKYPTAELFKQSRRLLPENRRDFVKSELKTFSSQSQSDLQNYLLEKAQLNKVIEGHNFWITNVISCSATKEIIHELNQRSDIESIDHDEIRYMLFENETAAPAEPNLSRGTAEITNNVIKVNAPAVWDLGYTGQGVVVAVLDVGVNYNHVDLKDHMWEHPDYPNHGYDFAYNDNDPMDDNGHGTHCAGTVAGDGTGGSQTGMAPDALIMALKVLNEGGGGQESDSWEAIEFTVDYGGDIMSMSIGWMHSFNPARATWRNALDNALAAGVVAAIAAGNDGGSISNPDDVRTPGDCPPPWLNPDQTLTGGISACVCVGATDNNDNLASFSSIGPSSWETISPYNDYPFSPELGLLRPDVSAPGVNIKSCNAFNVNGYTTMSGTSMATPGVAGVMALLLSKVPGLSPETIDIALETTAVDLGTPGKDNRFGAGRIDALEALNNLIEIFPPINLQISTDQETGIASLSWMHSGGIGFQNFKVYRDDVEIGTTTDMTFEDQLTDFGYYTYKITAFYGGVSESDPAINQTQYGSSTIVITPDEFTVIVKPNQTEVREMYIKNIGVLGLTYSLSPFFKNTDVADWISINPDNGLVGVEDSTMVELTFDSQGKDIGSYNETLNFITNDLITTNYYVELTMIVNDMELTANSSSTEICYGGSAQLEANVSGGSGTYEYQWTSVPEGFTSVEESPLVEPIVNTEYFVSVSDGLVTITASVSVDVIDLPIVNLGDNMILCGVSEHELDAGNPGDIYMWSTNETTQTIIASGSGEKLFWAQVTNQYGCFSKDSITLNFAQLPVVELGSDTTICGGANITLDAGNPGSQYLWSSNQTSRTIVADTAGFGTGTKEYSVEVTNEPGCVGNDAITIEFIDCTDINELSSVDIAIYPNPSDGVFNIELTGQANKPLHILVMNVSGKVIYRLENVIVSGKALQKINISEFSNGIYNVSISDGSASKSLRIILNK
jgi:subtilisin family serine protease